MWLRVLRSPVATTAKIALAVGVVTYAGASALSGGFTLDSLPRIVVVDARTGPETTGSFLPRLDQTRLDPCVAPSR